MIIEFLDKLKRTVIVDTRIISAIIENVEYTTSGNDHRTTGTWDVFLSGHDLAFEVNKEVKEFIVEKWESNG